jgi:hypothetical protein
VDCRLDFFDFTKSVCVFETESGFKIFNFNLPKFPLNHFRQPFKAFLIPQRMPQKPTSFNALKPSGNYMYHQV